MSDSAGNVGTKNQLQSDEAFALKLDATDPLRGFRERFCIPKTSDGRDVIYLAGNSLGLQPKTARPLIEQELKDWAELAVEGHFQGKTPWFSYHEIFREIGARLVGARPGEVVMMNSLTVNLHLMMVTFYRPTKERFKILIEDGAFPSDTYAVKSQLKVHGFDSAEALVLVRPPTGEHLIRTEDVEALLEREGGRIALCLMSGVNFFTGQCFDIPRITAVARNAGCIVGWDLAHAAGNVPLKLHDWDVDFAAWCNYKYLNSGPGAVAGCFVHERHGQNIDLPRFAGWWGNDPATRFKMHLQPEFVAREGADGWQISNPPIFSLAPVKASLDIFDEVGMATLREKSLRLTGYLEFLLDSASARLAASGRLAPAPQVRGEPAASRSWGCFEIITPRDPAARGCQLSILVRDHPKERFKSLEKHGVVCDFREPNVIRAAPTPLYNSYHDICRFARILTEQW